MVLMQYILILTIYSLDTHIQNTPSPTHPHTLIHTYKTHHHPPAVSQESLQYVRGAGRPEHTPLDTTLFEVVAVDLVWAEPLLDSLLDAVTLRKAY